MSFEDSIRPKSGQGEELQLLEEQLREIADGKMDMTIRLHSNQDVFQQIERTLNTVLNGLWQQIQTLQTEIGRLKISLFKYDALVNNIPDIAWCKDPNLTYIIVNQAIATASGKSIEYLIGKTDLDIWPYELAIKYRQDDRSVIESGVRFQCEELFQDVNGELKWIETIKTPIWDENGNLLGTVGIARDITHRKQMEKEYQDLAVELEKRVQDRTLQLQKTNEAFQKSNQALERFATLVSHDLQGPLRKILLFSDHLKQSAQEKLNEEELDDLNRLRSATKKMQMFVDDLLALSRITRRGKPFQKIDLFQVLHEALADLHDVIKDNAAKIEVGKMMTIEADPDQMRQLFIQMVDNAVKFHQENKAPLIRISVYPSEENLCQIRIEDNGIGIEEQHFETLFDPFVRFQPKSQYEGMGTGLALVKNIVERHGGSIDVQSTPQQGTVFLITLPVSQTKFAAEVSPNNTP